MSENVDRYYVELRASHRDETAVMWEEFATYNEALDAAKKALDVARKLGRRSAIAILTPGVRTPNADSTVFSAFREPIRRPRKPKGDGNGGK